MATCAAGSPSRLSTRAAVASSPGESHLATSPAASRIWSRLTVSAVADGTSGKALIDATANAVIQSLRRTGAELHMRPEEFLKGFDTYGDRVVCGWLKYGSSAMSLKAATASGDEWSRQS